MVDPSCAALDPIFWLHHGNIDRLWNDWIASGGGRGDPSEASWNNAPFVFHDETAAAVTMTAAEILDTVNQLGYRYDDVPPSRRSAFPAPEPSSLTEPAPPTQPTPPGPPELVAATSEPITLIGSPSSVTLHPPPAAKSLVETAVGGSGRILVGVEDIKAAVNPGVVYGVYLNLPTTAGVDRHDYHVGNVSLFGIERMNDPDARHDGAPGFRHVFDATRVARRLSAEGLWNPAEVTVTFAPIGLLPPPGEEDTWEDGGAAARDVPPVEFGRVSLFVA